MGASTAGKIQLHNHGGGFGWYFDETPSDDIEFTAIGSPFAASFVDVNGQTGNKV